MGPHKYPQENASQHIQDREQSLQTGGRRKMYRYLIQIQLILRTGIDPGKYKKSFCQGKSFENLGGAELLKSFLSHGNIFIQVHILGSLQQFHTFFKRTLKCLASQDQSHTAGALINNSSIDGIL